MSPLLALIAACSMFSPPPSPPPPKPDPLVEESNLSWEYCDWRWRNGELKTRVGRARCIAAGELPIYKKYRYPHLDLIVLLHQKRVELARREDRGEHDGILAAEWQQATDAVGAEEARRLDLLKADLKKPVTTQQAWLRKLSPYYRPWAVVHTTCVWAGVRLSCRVDSRPTTSTE